MGKANVDYDATDGESTFRGFVLPLVMIGIGFVLRLILAMHGSSAVEGMGLIVCQLVLSVFVMLIGCATASMMLSLNFGPIDRAALKLAATTLCAGAIGTIIAQVGTQFHMQGQVGIIAWHVVILSYWIFFGIFFSLGLQETLLSVCIVAVMQLGVSLALSKLLGIGDPMALFFSR